MELKSAGRLGMVLTLLGATTAIVIAALTAWADFEALSYFGTGAGYDPFDGLRCPSIMSLTEKATVTARFGNPTDKMIEPRYKAEISGATVFRTLEGQAVVPAHGSREVAWTVDAKDIDLGYFVLVRLLVLPVAGNATREATCGLLALNVGNATGGQALILAVIVSVLFTMAGLLVPTALLRPVQRLKYDLEASTPSQRALQALGIVSTGAILPALAGVWLAAWILCMISLLLLLIVLKDALS